MVGDSWALPQEAGSRVRKPQHLAVTDGTHTGAFNAPASSLTSRLALARSSRQTVELEEGRPLWSEAPFDTEGAFRQAQGERTGGLEANGRPGKLRH
jgi:hypothetical protein